MRRINFYFAVIILNLVFSSCEDFLSERNTSNVSNIYSLQDMQALMDAGNKMNFGVYCSLLEIATDNFFLGYVGFSQASNLHKSMYLWENEYTYELGDESINWTTPYHVIAIANTVLDELPLVEETNGLDRNHIKGTALFHRAFAYHNLVQVYCKAYDPLTAHNDLGLPMRLNSDVNLPSKRSSLEDTFQIIEDDIRKAIELLPVSSEYQTRPNKASAYALMARVNLLMGRYSEALKYADLSLSIFDTVLDYNKLDSSLAFPIDRMNEETVFFAYSTPVSLLLPSRECYIDTALYNSYLPGDLRKDIYFQHEFDGFYTFRGNYGGMISVTCFVGLTVSELLLIKSEALARLGFVDLSLDALNQLLVNRYAKDSFKPLVVTNDEELLPLILEERRKELIFRGARWSDLKRLNLDPQFATTLTRKVPGTEDIISLPPNDPRYVFLIPQDVIEMTGMKQNPR